MDNIAIAHQPTLASNTVSDISEPKCTIFLVAFTCVAQDNQAQMTALAVQQVELGDLAKLDTKRSQTSFERFSPIVFSTGPRLTSLHLLFMSGLCFRYVIYSREQDVSHVG